MLAGGTKKVCHEAFVGLARVVRVRLLTDMETQDLKQLSRKILPPAMINQLIAGDASGLLDHDGHFLISKQAVQKLFEWSSGTGGLGGKDAALLRGSSRQVISLEGGGSSFTPATSVGSMTAVDVPSQPAVRVKMQDLIAAHDETMCFAVPAADGLLSGLIRQPRSLTESERRLLEAVRDGDVDEVEKLLAAAPEAVNARHPDHGATALHYAAGGVEATMHAGEGKEEGTGSRDCPGRMLDILLAHGADVNARADNGTTPLHWAAGMGNAVCVKALLERGASPMLTTCTWARQVYGRGSGQTAAHHAAEGGHVQCLRIISAHDPLACHTKDERGSRPKELGMQELQEESRHVYASPSLERPAHFRSGLYVELPVLRNCLQSRHDHTARLYLIYRPACYLTELTAVGHEDISTSTPAKDQDWGRPSCLRGRHYLMGDTKRAAAREIINAVSPLRRATGGSTSPSSGPPSARRGTDLSPKGPTSAGGAEVDDRTKATGPPRNAPQEVRVGVGQVPLKPLAVGRAPSERQSPPSTARSARPSTGAGVSGRTAVRPSPREASDLPQGKTGATPRDENVIRVTPRVSDSGVGVGADEAPVMEPKPPPSTRMEECKTLARPERPPGPSMQAPAQAPRPCSPVAGVKVAPVETMRPFVPASISAPSSTTQGGGPGSQPAKARESPSTPEPNSRPMYQSLSNEQQPVMLGGALFKKPASMEKLFIDTTELISIVSKNPYKSPSPIPLPDAAGVPRPWERENAAAALGFNTKPSMSEKRAKLRGSMALPLPDGVLARVRHILGDTVDTGELLSLLKSSAQEQAALGGHGDGSSAGAGQKGTVASCWDHVLKSKPYKLLSSIQESVARVYVLATAKQLLEGVVETRLATDKAKNAELDLRCLTDMIAANVRVLTSFSALSEAPQMDGRTEAHSCLASLPVPALVVKYFRTVPFLSQAFITLVRSSLKLLMTSDEQVRRITLENSVSGRYFFSSSLLKRDLETIWEYLSIVRVYLEFYGQLSRDIFVQTVLPFTPLTKLEIFALISVGHARQKVALEQEQKTQHAATSVGSIADSARLTGPTSPTSTRAGDKGLKLSVAGPAMNEMDPDTLEAICSAFFSEDPFRCSPFLVTFAPRGMDVRPTYASLAKDTERFPQLFLSLSRHLYVTRCTPEGIEEFFKQHYSVVHDYLTCSQLARIAAAALGEIEPVVQLTQRTCGDWTANLYADMVVSSFISRFYKDFARRVATDTSVLAFSRRFEEVRSDQEYREVSTGDAGMHQTSDNFNRLSDAKGTSIELKSWEELSLGPVYILMVSERALDGLRLADKICMRDPMCACEMAGAIVMWYILWARASLGRCVSATSKPLPEDRGPAAPPYSHIFDSLRRVCALCSDVNSIAQFCESMLSRVRIDDEAVCTGPRTARSPTTPTAGGGYFFGSSSVLPSTPSGGGSKTTRKGFIVSPGHKSQKLAATRSVSSPPGPETTMAGLMTMGGRKTTDNGSMAAYANGGDMAGDVAGHEVVMNDLMGMVEDLRLLAAECLEHATEIATRLAVKICSDRLLSVSSAASRPIRSRSMWQTETPRPVAEEDAAVQPAGVGRGGNGAGGAAAAAATKRSESSRRLRAGRASLPATKQPTSGARVWAVELRTAVLQPLASFCRSDQFCSECLLPRLVEACLNAALEFIADEMEGRVTVSEGHALHADFLALKLWTEVEQRSQKWACALSRLSVFDRIHVIMNILCLPPSLTSWTQADKASLYLLPDAPEWINVRADRGRCSSYHWIGFSRNPASVAPLCLRRLSVTVASMDLYEFDKVWSEHASRHHGASEIHHAIA